MLRTAFRSVVLALAFALFAAPGAGAATSLSIPRPDGRQVKVTWPLESATSSAAPSTRLRVQLRQPAKRAVLVTVRLDRLGEPRTTVRTKRLRRGVVAFTLPQTEARYELVLKARGKVARRSVVTVSNAVAPGEPVPGDPGPAIPSCPLDATIAGTLGEVTSGDSHPEFGTWFGATLTNTGTGCLAHPRGQLERFTGGSWVVVPQPPVAEPAIFIIVRPGTTTRIGAYVTPDLPAGEYRLVSSLQLYADEPGTLPPPVRVLRTFTYGGIAP